MSSGRPPLTGALPEVLHYGDCLAPGLYTLEARFRRSVHFRRGEHYLFLVTPEIGAGPLNVVVSRLPESLPPALQLKENELWWGAHPVKLSPRQRYHSRLNIPPPATEVLPGILSRAREFLRHHAPPGSLVSLIESADGSPPRNALEQALARALRAAMGHLENGEWIPAVQCLRGRGAGLTPGGDDFIAGMLLALHLYPPQRSGVDGSLPESILQAARSSHPLVNCFLKLAGAGRVAAPVQAWLQAVCWGNSGEIHHAGQKLLKLGATSGADLAFGWVTTLGILANRGVFT